MKSSIFSQWSLLLKVLKYTNGDRARSGVQNLWDAPDFLGADILPCKKPLDLQVFSRIGKTMKKLQWIPNTIMNISLTVILW